MKRKLLVLLFLILIAACGKKEDQPAPGDYYPENSQDRSEKYDDYYEGEYEDEVNFDQVLFFVDLGHGPEQVNFCKQGRRGGKYIYNGRTFYVPRGQYFVCHKRGRR